MRSVAQRGPISLPNVVVTGVRPIAVELTNGLISSIQKTVAPGKGTRMWGLKSLSKWRAAVV